MNFSSVFNIFRRGEVAVSITGIDADGHIVRTVLKDGQILVPNRGGSSSYRVIQPTIELDLTHGDGEAILITSRLPQIHGALLTVDTSQIDVTGAEPMEGRRRHQRAHDSIKSYEVDGNSTIRLMIANGATPVHRELRGFIIKAKR